MKEMENHPFNLVQCYLVIALPEIFLRFGLTVIRKNLVHQVTVIIVF
jgi:hypothetical protein